MCFYQDESPEFYSESIVRSRKPHRCGGCGRTIEARELCVSGSGKIEGHFYTFRTCGACDLDCYRIHIAELAEGCRDYESWCPPDELSEHLPEYGLDRSPKTLGERWLERSKRVGWRRLAPQEAYRKEQSHA